MEHYQPQVNLKVLDENSPKPKRVLGGLLVLAMLGALVLAVVYYRWYEKILPGTSSETESSASEANAEKPGRVSSSPSRRKVSKHHGDAEAASTDDAQEASAGAIVEASMRSPLAVEVISDGGHHQIVPTADDAIYLDSEDNAIAAANVDSVLGKQQTIEGSVVLLARIDKDGRVQDLHALSGPPMLFAAAREAVKQWRFKPYYQSGQAVETETQVTVKFAISAH